jgi:hypothetical protein
MLNLRSFGQMDVSIKRLMKVRLLMVILLIRPCVARANPVMLEWPVPDCVHYCRILGVGN